jgi:hypothetical protein
MLAGHNKQVLVGLNQQDSISRNFTPVIYVKKLVIHKLYHCISPKRKINSGTHQQRRLKTTKKPPHCVKVFVTPVEVFENLFW